ncbi:MAG: RrF2 family transcriptional regulator, partial [Acidobacteriota bacterium]
MKVTAQEEYGLRCMMQAAASGSDRPVSVAVIASSEGISTAYAAKILNLLRDAGLVESMRGRCGGYYITHPPDRISVSEILAALGGRLFEAEYCERFPGDEDECVHLGECSLRPP